MSPVFPGLPGQLWVSRGSGLHWGDAKNQSVALGYQRMASLPGDSRVG